MSATEGPGRLTKLGDAYAGYEGHDSGGEEICAVDDTRGVIEVSRPKDTVEKAPPIGDDMALTPEYLAQLRDHYGL